MASEESVQKHTETMPRSITDETQQLLKQSTAGDKTRQNDNQRKISENLGKSTNQLKIIAVSGKAMGPLALLGKERETLNGNGKQRQKRAGKKSGKIERYKGGITKKIHSAKIAEESTGRS